MSFSGDGVLALPLSLPGVVFPDVGVLPLPVVGVVILPVSGVVVLPVPGVGVFPFSLPGAGVLPLPLPGTVVLPFPGAGVFPFPETGKLPGTLFPGVGVFPFPMDGRFVLPCGFGIGILNGGRLITGSSGCTTGTNCTSTRVLSGILLASLARVITTDPCRIVMTLKELSSFSKRGDHAALKASIYSASIVLCPSLSLSLSIGS